MQYKKRFAPALIATLMATPVYATFISTGGTNGVWPYNSASQANYSGTMYVGGGTYFITADGTFEVNASSVGNGRTYARNKGLSIGSRGATGVVKVVGNGVSGSARIDIDGGSGLRNGINGNGTLEIKNGGVVYVDKEDIYLGDSGWDNNNSSVSTTLVDGPGSRLIANQEDALWGDGGRIHVGFTRRVQSSVTVDIKNGGSMEALGNGSYEDSDGSIWIGDSAGIGSTVTVNVSGFDAASWKASMMYADKAISVGPSDYSISAQLNISNRGAVKTNGSLWIAGNPASEASVTINTGGYLEADEIQIGTSGSVFPGYLADGTPVAHLKYDSSAAGLPVTDFLGNPVFDRAGNPVLTEEADIFPGYFWASTYNASNKTYMKSTGSLIVDGALFETQVKATTINVSENNSAAETYNGQGSTLTVRNNGFITGDVNVYKDGTLNGDRGSIAGTLTVDGGTVAPGNSPGMLYITEDLNMLSGLLQFELGFGGESDWIEVSGDVFLGSGVKIEILLGDTFNNTLILLDELIQSSNPIVVEDGFDPLTNITLLGAENSLLGADASIGFAYGDGQEIFILREASGSGSPVPSPATVWLLALGLAGLGISRRREEFRITTA